MPKLVYSPVSFTIKPLRQKRDNKSVNDKTTFPIGINRNLVLIIDILRFKIRFAIKV